MKVFGNTFLLFILIVFILLLSNCDSDNIIHGIDLDGVVINYTLIENKDTNADIRFTKGIKNSINVDLSDNNNPKISFNKNPQYVKDSIMCFTTPYFSIIERPVPYDDSIVDHPIPCDCTLELKFNNSPNSISLIRFDESYYRLFETNDFYYFPFRIYGSPGFNVKKDVVYKLGILVIYKESFKYDTLSFHNENYISIRQIGNKLIVKTNKMYPKIDLFGLIFHDFTAHHTKYILEPSDEYKEYIFVK